MKPAAIKKGHTYKGKVNPRLGFAPLRKVIDLGNYPSYQGQMDSDCVLYVEVGKKYRPEKRCTLKAFASWAKGEA